MKAFTLFILSLVSAALAFAGCDQRDRNPIDPVTQAQVPAPTPPGDAPATPPLLQQPVSPPSDLIVGVMQQLKDSTYETRSTIAAAYDPVNRQIEERVALWKTNGSQFTEPAERQLQDARATVAQKFKELGEASEETWNSAKDNATSALFHLQGAINDLRESDKLRRS